LVDKWRRERQDTGLMQCSKGGFLPGWWITWRRGTRMVVGMCRVHVVRESRRDALTSWGTWPLMMMISGEGVAEWCAWGICDCDEILAHLHLEVRRMLRGWGEA
jgi:hypothetical protein